MPFIPETNRDALLLTYKAELQKELRLILDWWLQYSKDEQGGFYAAVNNCNAPYGTEKGIVLNSRILWTFSAAYCNTQREEYLQTAGSAFRYIEKNFIDYRYGGVFWSVDAKGKMKDGRKQVYGIAFCLYGMAEYYKASRENAALVIAKDLFHVIEQQSFDAGNGGYIEAFSREWYPATDLRLSDKDDNERKTMNTHLHVIEAYASLYMVWPDAHLKSRIELLLEYFEKHFINPETGHLRLFFNDQWELKSSLISFGHDVEAAWLLHQCAVIIQQQEYIERYKKLSLLMADAAARGIDTRDGGLWYEYDPGHHHWIKEKHWWPQAEAMVGFFHAYELTGNSKYLNQSLNSYEFVKQYIKDNTHGEWFWGINDDGSLIEKEKAGFWKCPYHNGRACIELINRITSVKQS